MAIIGISKGLKSRGGYNVDIRFDGNWIKFNELVNNTDVNIAIAARAGQREFAEAYRDALVKHLDEGCQRFQYPPHNPDYLKTKLRHGGDPGMLQWGGSMKNAIQTIRSNINNTWAVGIPKNIKRPKYYGGDNNRLTISEYANILEHGSPPELPARPLFADTFKKTMGGIDGIKKFIENALITRFGAEGFYLTKF